MSGLLLIVLIFAGVVFGLYYLGILAHVAIFFLFVIMLGVFYKVFVKKYEPYESALVYRFGRLHRISPAGWTIVLPMIEKIGAVVDLREQKEHISIPVITKEGLKLNILALAYFYVNNARNAILNIQDYRSALLNLIESQVRDIAGEFTFTQLVVNVEQVEEILNKEINTPITNWGLVLNNFQIEHIKPPEQVMQAMEQKRVSAENLEAQRFVAEARKIITRALGEGTKSFDDKTISYLYIKALENMKSAKMMLPGEFMGMMSGGMKQPANGVPVARNNLAQGMIAGTTFSKALGMIGDEVTKDAVVDIHELKKDKVKDINVNDVEGVDVEDVGPNDVDEGNLPEIKTSDEEAAAGFDAMDGEIDGHYDDSEHKPNIP